MDPIIEAARATIEKVTGYNDPLRAALAEIVRYEANQSRQMDDDEQDGGAKVPTGDDWNDLSAVIRRYAHLVKDA